MAKNTTRDVCRIGIITCAIFINGTSIKEAINEKKKCKLISCTLFGNIRILCFILSGFICNLRQCKLDQQIIHFQKIRTGSL